MTKHSTDTVNDQQGKPRRDDGTGLIEHDPWLEPYADALRHRHRHYLQTREKIEKAFGSLEAAGDGHHYFGFNRGEHAGKDGVWYREWAPGARSLSLIGDFNDWDRRANPLHRDDFGVWSTFLPDETYGERFIHGSLVKVHVESELGPWDRMPAYIRYAVQDPQTHKFTGVYWFPPQPYAWKHPVPAIKGGLRIYEAHVGMATEEQRVGTYREFTEDVLPHIASLGYNAVQLMAIQEHPYYGSFGYHVSSFFAPSSRFGTPYELKELIDTAHGLGLRVLLDIVHSHAVKNFDEGLNFFDGTDHQYFHGGGRGNHDGWDSRLFNYSHPEVLRFLLSNVKYWLEEFHFDGFRFDGVTSMMYLHHGMKAFTCYDDYLRWDLDEDAISYLQLANELAQTINPEVITIAEDVSGMVGLARPIQEGGLGYSYRLAMGVPDYWIKILKHKRDEDWQMGEMFQMLMNRRQHEKHVAYAESHDQALVGDKTLAFWLMDADMYWFMNTTSKSPVIDRGIALHKMLRLVTFASGGEAYLNFIGNEFGHPEWVDFPREGNGFSYKHARRQWSLATHQELRYKFLCAFDGAMQHLDADHGLLEDTFIQAILLHEDDKLLCFRRGPLVFLFNFHPTQSWTDYRMGVPDPTDYQVILDTDAAEFGGFGRATPGQVYPLQTQPWNDRPQSVQVYLPSRSAQVLAPRGGVS